MCIYSAKQLEIFKKELIIKEKRFSSFRNIKLQKLVWHVSETNGNKTNIVIQKFFYKFWNFIDFYIYKNNEHFFRKVGNLEQVIL